MKKIILLVNEKDGGGKTTIGLNLAAAAAEKNRAVYFEISDSVFDSGFYTGTGKEHDYEEGKAPEKYMWKGGNFYLARGTEENFGAMLKEFSGITDILILDTSSFPGNGILEAADLMVVPAKFGRQGIRHACYTIETLKKMKFPMSSMTAAVNMVKSSIMSAEDMEDMFLGVKAGGVLPFLEVKEEKTGRMFLDNGKNSAAREIKKILERVPGGAGDRDHLSIYEKARAKKPVPAAVVSEEADAAPGEKRRETADKFGALKKKVHKEIFSEIDVNSLEKDALSHPKKRGKIFEEVKEKIRGILDKMNSPVKDRDEREIFIREVFNEVAGLGAIEELLHDREISEIMVNRHDEIYIEKKGKLIKSANRFTDDSSVLRAIERIVTPLGRRIDESVPYVDARLADGSRVNAIIPPLAVDGPVITIRKFSDKKLTIDDLIRFGSLESGAAEFLKETVEKKKNIIVSGGTGSGKTTLLNVLSSFIPEDERIITVEDSAELRLSQEHVIRLEARPPNIEGKGAVTIRDLVKNCLRMRPDRIVVGECRGGEALDMLQAMNTGHEGSMTTVHANAPRDALSRLEVMVLMSGAELPLKAVREQIKSAVDIIIQQARLADGSRKVTYISEVTGMEGDTILMHDVFKMDGERGLNRVLI